MPAAATKTFGKYQALRKIGSGGFGVVYEGYDPKIRRKVAIKTCSSVDPAIRKRFAREAEIAGNLSHRHITIVFDFGEEDGVPYLVQEFLDGEDLDRKIERREPVSLARRIGYLEQIAEGLAYAHRQGVVHRDIKPSNIRVLGDDSIKVMDFGIARVKNDLSLTTKGRAMGTAAYLAPEQLSNEPATPRSDIFSFGVVAYELITFARAFTGKTPSQILYQVLNEDPPPIATLEPACPPELAALVFRCFRKDPDERYPDLERLLAPLAAARALVERREHARAHPAPTPPPPPPPQPPPLTSAQPRGPETTDPASLGGVALRSEAVTAPIPVVRATARRRGRRWLPWALTGAAALAAALWLGAGPLRERLGRAAAGTEAAAAGPLASPGDEPRQPDAPPAEEEQTPATASGEDASAERQPSSSPPSGPRAQETPERPRPSVADAPTNRRRPLGRSTAALSVRVGLGSRQGIVLVDGVRVGRTPLRRFAVTPGRHTVRILGPGGAAGGSQLHHVNVGPGMHKILTFDLAAKAPPREVERPLQPPRPNP